MCEVRWEGRHKSWPAVPSVSWTTAMGIPCNEVISVLMEWSDPTVQQSGWATVRIQGHLDTSNGRAFSGHHPVTQGSDPVIAYCSPAPSALTSCEVFGPGIPRTKPYLPRTCPQASDSKLHSLNRLFLASLKSAMIKGCREPPYPSILTDATMEKLALAKFVAQESKCEVSGWEETPVAHHWPSPGHFPVA